VTESAVAAPRRVPGEEQRASLLSSASLLTVAMVGSGVLAYVFQVLVARRLGPEAFGSPPSLPPHAIAVTTPTAPTRSKTKALRRIEPMLAADAEAQAYYAALKSRFKVTVNESATAPREAASEPR